MGVHTVRVEVDDAFIDVAPEFEALARAILSRNLFLIDIYRTEPDGDEVPEGHPEYFTVVLPDSETCIDLATLVVTGAPDSLRESFLSDDWAMHGSFSIHPEDEEQNGPPLTCFMHLDFPMELLSEVTKSLEAHGDYVPISQSTFGDVTASDGSLLDPSTVPRALWDGSFVPPVPGIDKVVPGVHVRLGFAAADPATHAERVWVRVTSVGERSLEGTLTAAPLTMSNLTYGDSVTFRPQDVLEVSLEVPESSRELLN